MRKWLFSLSATLALVAGSGLAAAPTDGMVKGSPALKSISALTFGPSGVIFVGDPVAATLYAVATGDTEPGGKADVNVAKIDEMIGSMLGVSKGDVAINDVKVNPASGNIYLAVTRGKGAMASPIILKLDRAGKVAEFALKDVMFSSVKIPNATEKQRTEAITSLAYIDGKLIVAGLSNEEFASTLRTIPVPFKDADKGTSVEIFHGAHNKIETNAPIRTFTTYQIGGADYLLAAYTCTPLVKVPVADLKAGTKVKGTTIAELGNGNRPLDMITYQKDGKGYLLMANNKRGVMKIPTEGMGDAMAITSKPKTAIAGVPYETIAELKGVVQLDRLDAGRALILVLGDDASLTLKSIPMP